MSGLQSLYNLLDKRLDIPCMKAAQEFLSSLKSENDRLSLATNGLAPLLENRTIKPSLRILAAYLLYAVYDFNNTPNPFYTRIAGIYKTERSQSLSISVNQGPSSHRTTDFQQQTRQADHPEERLNREKDSSHGPLMNRSYPHYYDDSNDFISRSEGSGSPFERVLWKILNGEADELSTYSATTLADVELWETKGYHQNAKETKIPSDMPFHTHQRGSSNLMPTMNINNNPPRIPSSLPPAYPAYPSPISPNHPFTDDKGLSPHGLIQANQSHSIPGYGVSSFAVDAISRPPTQKTPTAPGSFRPSSVRHQSSPSSASSTIESSSISTSSFINSSFMLPPTDPTRSVDASTFHIPEVNRWSTRSDIALGIKVSPETKLSPLPLHIERRISPVAVPKPLQSTRNPGVIGSGRPSSITPSDSSERGAENRASSIGILGNTVARGYQSVSPADASFLYRTGDSTITRPSEYRDPTPGAQYATDASLSKVNTPDLLRPSMLRDSFADHLTSTNGPQNPQIWRKSFFQNHDLDDGRTLRVDALPAQSDANPNTVGRRVPNTELNQISHSKRTPGSSQPTPELPIPQNQGSPPSQLKPHQEDEVAIRERDRLVDAILLYMAARERVLTLQEQKKLQPHLSMLTRPICILRPEDISSLVANNQDLAVKLLLCLFSEEEKDARQIEELLKKADLERNRDDFGPDSMESLTLVSEMVKLVSSYGNRVSEAATSDGHLSLRGSFAMSRYLEALADLPPTIQSFGVIGKLLMPNGQASGEEDSKRIATLIRTQVLGGFISGCIRWIERVDRDEREGRVHDDRVATATGNLCRFYTSLLKNGIITAYSEEDTTEIMSFALQFSRFETAQSLYSTLAAARA